MPTANVTITYLQMLDPRELRPRRAERTGLSLVRIDPPMPELNRFFYTAVGGDWFWIDRLSWTYQQWLDYLNRPALETWMLTVQGIPAGFYELERQAKGDVEIAYFGLLPAYVGQGLGGHLLTCAVERAWAISARRVWLHTCTLDHPQAIANYRARGFQPYKDTVKIESLPDQPLGPWPGAAKPQTVISRKDG